MLVMYNKKCLLLIPPDIYLKRLKNPPPYFVYKYLIVLSVLIMSASLSAKNCDSSVFPRGLFITHANCIVGVTLCWRPMRYFPR